MFVNPVLKISNIDNYMLRHSIFFCLKNSLTDFKGVLLDIGCGSLPYKEYVLSNSSIVKYVGLDLDSAISYGSKADATWDGERIPFDDNSIQTIICTEVLEHVFTPSTLLCEIKRVLDEDGVAIFSVPFIWNLHEVPHDYYRYTPFALEKLFSQNGLQVIKRYRYGGWGNLLIQALAGWTKRGGEGFLRKMLEPIVYFLILKKYIHPTEVPSLKDFNEGDISIGYFYLVSKATK